MNERNKWVKCPECDEHKLTGIPCQCAQASEEVECKSLLGKRNIKTAYHRMDSCNKCGGTKNKMTKERDAIDYVTCEAETKCLDCGHRDYWAYGWFESGQEIESKAKTYLA